MAECIYACGQKDIKNLEEHYQIDHAMNQGLRDPVVIKDVKVTAHENRPDLVEAKKIADKEREQSAKTQLHPLLQKDANKVKETIVTIPKTTTAPTVTTAQKVKSEQDNMGTASSQPK
jgi:hypothetical protein